MTKIERPIPHAARRLLWYGPTDALPSLPELFRAKAAREAVDAARRGQHVPDREVDLDGLIVSLNARPLPGGGVLVVLHDLTELKRLEAARRDFLVNVSHELKTPLTSVSGYAETLLAEETDAETRRRFLQIILDNARRMQQLVEDQLNLARIESGRWQPRPALVDVAAAAREAWAARAERGDAASVAFTVTADPGAERIWADPEAVRQILDNLLDNAVRYTPAGGRITCTSTVEDGVIAFTVSDTGSGIGGEHLPRIFERYYRADPARSREAGGGGGRLGGGTGLGMAIVKHLVEAHGGRVSAESELGRGTRIRCWFPA
ncbi:MAG: hypothetical protein K6U89_19860 [Chloroflexi bacterium]|nr:hypothetical protein [Chloroflexota bacterium]